MDKTWDIVKTVAGAFVIVYAIQGGWALAKHLGREEAIKELGNSPYIEKGSKGDKVIVNMGGERYTIALEKIND